MADVLATGMVEMAIFGVVDNTRWYVQNGCGYAQNGLFGEQGEK